MRTLPEAYMTLTLDEIDAAIATFCDPLTADEVVALAQWWTLRHIHTTITSYIPDEELVLMAALGDWQAAWEIGMSRPTAHERFEDCLAIYDAVPSKPAALTTLFLAELEQLSPQPRIPPNIAKNVLRLLCQMELYELAGMFLRLNAEDDRTTLCMILVRSYLQAGSSQQALESIFTVTTKNTEKRLSCLSEGVGCLATLGDMATARRWLARLRREYEQLYHGILTPDASGNVPLPAFNPAESAAAGYMTLYLLNGYVAVEDWAEVCHWLRIYLTLTRGAVLPVVVDVFAKAVARTRDIEGLFNVGMLLASQLTQLQLMPVQRLIELEALEQAHTLLRQMQASPDNCASIITLYQQAGWGDQTLALLQSVVAQFYKIPSERKNQFKQLITSLFQEQHIPEAMKMMARAVKVLPYRPHEYMAEALDSSPTDATVALVRRWLADPMPAYYKDETLWDTVQIKLLLTCFKHDADAARSREWYNEMIARLQRITDTNQRAVLYQSFAETLSKKGWLAEAYHLLMQIGNRLNSAEVMCKVGRQALEHGDRAVAVACLALAQRQWQLLTSKVYQGRIRQVRDQWHKYRSAVLPVPAGSQPSAMNMPQPTEMIGLWRGAQSEHVDHFLQHLSNNYPELEAHTPGLYPRVLKACLEIVGNFAPAWLTFVQTLEDMG